MYIARTETGLMFMKIMNSVASNIIENCDGYFTKKKYKNEVEKTVYVLTQDNVLNIQGNKTFFWCGTVLVPE